MCPVVSFEGESFVVDAGDQILEAERVSSVWHVVRLTAAGDLDIRVFYSDGNRSRLWYPSTSKGISFPAWRVHAALVEAIGTEAEKAAWLDSTDVPTCRIIETPWNLSDQPDDKTHTSPLPSLDGDPQKCLHCALVGLADFVDLGDREGFLARMQGLGVPSVYLEEHDLHLNVLASRPEWLAGAFHPRRFDEAIYREHREQVLEDALALSLHFGAHRKRGKKK